MNKPINPKTTTLAVRNSIGPANTGRGYLFVVFALAWFALSPAARAVDGDLGNANTAEGKSALAKLNGGTNNTAMGFQALSNDTTGGLNAATGDFALLNNTTGFANTANGSSALFSNTTGGVNTATGAGALANNTTGFANTASGSSALQFNTTGNSNTATGADALLNNATGTCNTASGNGALYLNTTGNNNTATGENALFGCPGECNSSTGSNNTATGVNALYSVTAGNNNTAEGFQALENSTGSNNIALGFNAGLNLTTGNNNIYIGSPGVASESNTIRIGTFGLQKSVYIRGINGASVPSGVTMIIGSNGRLGTVQSSARFKEAIKPMDKVSEAILELKPVTFRYKHELDPEGIPQFGLVAEEVEKINPDLVARDEQGKVYSVRYEAVNAMLLNEFLKAHCKVQQLEAAAADQQKEIKALTASVKEQAAQIQKVSAQLDLSKPAPQIANAY